MSGFAEEYEALEERRALRYRALGTRTPRCTVEECGETDPVALTGVHPNIVCREHLADALGESWTQDHHPPGKQNDPMTVPVPSNDHGLVSELQALWPAERLRNPDGSPLLRAAAWLRGWLVILQVIIERAVGRIPGALENLDRLLSRSSGRSGGTRSDGTGEQRARIRRGG
jgi:hypothetical protein